MVRAQLVCNVMLFGAPSVYAWKRSSASWASGVDSEFVTFIRANGPTRTEPFSLPRSLRKGNFM